MSARPCRSRIFRSLVALLVPALVVGACSDLEVRRTDGQPSPPGSGSASPPGVDLHRARVPRTEFCAALPEDDVATALGGPVVGTAHYGNGDRFEVRPGYTDVAHEYGCVFQGRDGTTARVWVFARPVPASEAQMLVRRTRRQRGCAFPDQVRFGRPGLTSVCEVAGEKNSPPAVRARLQGLFGDSWLACEVAETRHRGPRSQRSQASDDDLLQRAEDWCVGVVGAVAASS